MRTVDELERIIRDANPHRVRRGSGVSDRGERDLGAILAEPRSAPPVPLRPQRVGVIVSTVAAAITLLLSVATLVALQPRPAAAFSPPLLEVQPTEGNATAVLGTLSMIARSGTIDSATRVEIEVETWSMDIMIEPNEQTTFVQPREIVRTRDADLAGEVVVSAGSVRWGSVPPDMTPPPPGEELERHSYEAGSYPLLFPTPPPSDEPTLRTYLSTSLGLTADSAAGDYFRAVQDLRNEWPLSGPQCAAVLDLLADLRDVELLGEVIDRLDRPGLAFSTSTRMGGAFEDVLIFSPDTGCLLSAEVIYVGGLDDVALAERTVTNYTAWKEST